LISVSFYKSLLDPNFASSAKKLFQFYSFEIF
jgi:hypothetical protein